ncbi:MAG: hypothetical protein M1358_16635 [Chloroflexi bacterium]|nr:hypothetical protein [Chloroflexota bacterium]
MAEDKHPSSNSGETEEKNTGRDNQSVDHDESARADGKRHSHPVRDTSLHPELEWKEQMKGKQPGNRYVRVMRPYAREFKRRAPGHLVATERVLQPKGPSGRLGEFLRRLIIGRRIPSELEAQERTGKVKGLALFASDNISSSAYASEEIMRVLVLAGAAALLLTMPITIAIVIVLAVVVVSYSQVIRAYQ